MKDPITGIEIGPAQVDPAAPAHLRGVPSGNAPLRARRRKWIRMRGGVGVGAPERATGINPQDHEPIDSRSPRLFPA